MGNYGGDIGAWIHEPKRPFTGSDRDAAKRNKTRVTRGSKSSWVSLYGYAILNDGRIGVVVMFVDGYVAFYDSADGFDEGMYKAFDAADSKGTFIHENMWSPHSQIQWIGTPVKELAKKKPKSDPFVKEKAAIKSAWVKLNAQKKHG